MRRLLALSMLALVSGSGLIGLAPPSAAAEQLALTTPIHKIRADGSRLYDSVTGTTFLPRGANYVRLARASDGNVYHSTFEPGRYNPVAVRSFLDQMRHDGYNTVRVFIDPGAYTNEHGIGRGAGDLSLVNAAYMDNVAAFVQETLRHGLYTIPVLDYFPANEYYWMLAYRVNQENGGPVANVEGQNASYMDRGRVAAKSEYMKNFASALLARIGPGQSSAILAYQTDNELFWEADRAPFHSLSGTVTPLNGITYDMSSPASRQQAADASMVEYSYRIQRGLREAEPAALMVTGFFTPRAVGKAGFDGFMTHCSTACQPGVDYRYPGRPASLSIYGAADLIDVHLYPVSSADLTAHLSSIEMALFRKPYIVGEFGALKSAYGYNITWAAYAMRDTQIATCRSGAQGWLFWTWNTYEDMASQSLFFKLSESGGAINGQLAPIVRPNPCTI